MSEETGKHGVARFFSDNYRKLVRYFQANYSALSDMEAEDVVSDLMADLFEKADVMREVENLSAYIYRSIRNKANDYLRRRKKIVPYEGAAPGKESGPGREAVPEPCYDMEKEIEAAEIRDRLNEPRTLTVAGLTWLFDLFPQKATRRISRNINPAAHRRRILSAGRRTHPSRHPGYSVPAERGNHHVRPMQRELAA